MQNHLRNFSGRMFRPFLFLLLTSFVGIQVNAQCTITGAQLLSYPGTDFPTSTPSTVGSSIQFPTGTANALLMTLPVIPAGTLTPTSNVNTTMRLFMKRIASDNDPIMGFTDSTVAAFSGFLANDGLSHFKVDGTISGTTITATYASIISCGGSCGTNVGDNYIIDFNFTITSGAVALTATTTQGANTQTTSHTYTQTYDPSKGIEFMLGRQSTGESYQIDSVQFQCAFPPTISNFSSDTTVCEGDSVNLSVTAGGPSPSYQWQLNGTNIPGDTNATLNRNPAATADAGTYTCIVSNAFGADTTSNIVLTVNPNPVASISGPSAICMGDTVMLMGMVTSGTPSYAYMWGPNSETTQDISVSPASATTYTFMVSDSAGCSSGTDSLTIDVNPTPTATAMGDTICDGDSATISGMASGGTAPYTYTWNPGGLTGSSVMVAPGNNTNYDLVVTDSAGCEAAGSATVVVNALPVAGFTVATSQDTANFTNTSGGISWMWDFGDGNSSTTQDPQHIYAGNGTYVACVTATDASGCRATYCDSVMIVIVGIEQSMAAGNISLYPNPTSGQLNIIFDNEVQGDLNLEVFDMFGNSVWNKSMENMNQLRTEIDLQNLASGVYFLNVNSANGSWISKFVIER